MDYNAPPPSDDELPALLRALCIRAADADSEIRVAAVEDIYAIAFKVGAKASSAIPVLVERLADSVPKVSESASWALKYCAPESVAALTESLAHQFSQVREKASQALGNIGRDARNSAHALRPLLQDSAPLVRQKAAWALGLMHDDHPDTLEQLHRLTRTEQPADLSAALHALGNLGKNSENTELLLPFKGVIMAATSHSSSAVVRSALYASESLGLSPQEQADLYVSTLHAGSTLSDTQMTFHALADLAPSVDLSKALPVFMAILCTRQDTAISVCKVLAVMKPRPSSAIEQLVALLDEGRFVLPAAAALWAIEGRTESFMAAIERSHPIADESLCDFICALGPAATPLVPKVLAALAEEDWDQQWAAADALCAIACPETAVVQALMDALGHPSPVVQSASARALASLGANSVEALTAVLSNKEDARSAWAALSLGRIGVQARPAVEVLRTRMLEGTEPLHSSCAIALAHIAQDESSIPVLIDILQSEEPSAPRKAAAEALGALGPPARCAIPALRSALNDMDFELAEAAAEALAVIEGSRH